MAWSGITTATQLTSITTIQYFSTVVLLSPGELAVCEVEFDPVGTPTDDLIVEVWCTLDDSSENWDDTAYQSFSIDKDTDPNKVTFLMSGVYKFRVSVKRSGTTDTHTSADFRYRKDGVSA